jgi:hypothetical protein
MSDTKRKISAWIPAALYDEIEKAGYTSPTVAVTKGLELLVRTHSGDTLETNGDIPETNGDILGTNGDPLETFRRQTETERDYLRKEIERLKDIIDRAPDPVELAEVRAHFEGLQRLTEEKDKRIDDLTREVETLNVFAHYFKNVEVKQIEAPAAEKVKPWWKFW